MRAVFHNKFPTRACAAFSSPIDLSAYPHSQIRNRSVALYRNRSGAVDICLGDRLCRPPKRRHSLDSIESRGHCDVLRVRAVERQNISRMSQVKRLKSCSRPMECGKMIMHPSGDIVKLSSKESSDFEDEINYLVRTHGGQSIPKIFEPVTRIADWSRVDSWTLPEKSARRFD